MKTLDEIMVECESDKASKFSRTYARPHNYCVHLERFFAPIRNNPIKLAEVGVGGGESIRGWLEYFPAARIYGIDIVSNTNPFNTSIPKADPRYTFACGDQSKPEFWKQFIAQCGGDWDVICDDGSHVASDMKTTFTCLWQHLKSGGLYIVEDLNFDGKSKVWLESFISHIHGQTFNIDSIYFARELAVLRKR